MAKLIAIVLTVLLLGLATLSQAQTPPPLPNPKGSSFSATHDDIGTLRKRKGEMDGKVANREKEITQIENSFLSSKDGQKIKTKIENAKNRRDKAIQDANEKYSKFLKEFRGQSDYSTPDKQACCVYTPEEKLAAENKLSLAEGQAQSEFDNKRMQIIEGALKQSDPRKFVEYKKANAELKKLKQSRGQLAKKLAVAEQKKIAEFDGPLIPDEDLNQQDGGKSDESEKPAPSNVPEGNQLGRQGAKIENNTDKAHTKSDDSKHTLVDYCTIISDPLFQKVCYSEWRHLCGGIEDPKIQKRCRDTVRPGGPRTADGKLWDFCAFVISPRGRLFCYDGFRKMIAGSTCGAIQFPPSDESYLCRERARNLPSNLPPSERAVEAKRKCKGGGLVGVINCVTEQMGGNGDNRTQKGAKGPQRKKASAPPSASSADKDTGVTTTSVRNPDGTRTVTKTDKNGNVLSKEVVGKSPTSASSTDTKTGVTTTSVRNPDGSRTVTKTDKTGKVLSRERLGKSPDSASSTNRKTDATTTSVQNPDGSRTVTKTDKDGNILSREKVW